MDPNKQDQGALEAQKIKLYYNEVGVGKIRSIHRDARAQPN